MRNNIMKKKSLKLILAGVVAFTFVIQPVKALTTFTSSDWQTTPTEENRRLAGGSIEATSDSNVNIFKGNTTESGAMNFGPLTKKSTAMLKDGITEEVYIGLDPEKYENAEYFEVSVSLADKANPSSKNRGYLNEANIMTQKGYDDKFTISAPWAKFSTTTAEKGVYIYQWHFFVKNDKTYVNITIQRWDEENSKRVPVASTNEIDLEEAVVTGDTQKDIAKKPDAGLEHIWFCNIKVANGVEVYTKLPVKVNSQPAEVDKTNSDNTAENPNTYDNILIYVLVSLLGLSTIAYSTKKVLSR